MDGNPPLGGRLRFPGPAPAALARVGVLVLCAACEANPVSLEGSECTVDPGALECGETELLRCSDDGLLTIESDCGVFTCELHEDGEQWTCVDDLGVGAFCDDDLAPAGTSIGVCGRAPTGLGSEIRLECSFGKFEEAEECTVGSTCRQRTFESFGSSYTRAFCVAENGTGDWCDSAVIDRCVDQEIVGCSGEILQVGSTCKEDESCKQYEHAAYCVDPRGIGDWCERADSKEAPNQRCGGGTAQLCDPTSKTWIALSVCGPGTQCAETPAAGAERAKNASCQPD